MTDASCLLVKVLVEGEYSFQVKTLTDATRGYADTCDTLWRQTVAHYDALWHTMTHCDTLWRLTVAHCDAL